MSTEESVTINKTSDRQSHLRSLKDRLEKYKTKNKEITQKEAEEEARLLEKERIRRQEEERLEAERRILLEELKKAELQKAMLPTIPQVTQPQPQTVLQLQLELQQQLQRQQQQPQPQLQQQTMLANPLSFGYPTTITEKEAINWLKNSF
ncbi:hypothetical protein G6F57_006766 [Rhizopus arrhizus]|uniref:Uncharacterized protein n=1 Tax=Rhizopus oryzae TaxID=64495 RepID=A0A9P6X1M0_RHIOR|nr:hypothetical protein G6F23_006524 [Rhizopus arrhizus]KAG1414754.1 hypothetical protein G6F58_006805 [Rhizopus delemar]KAG0766975.1 hypothetical protein G6F24_003172 [Rhizopus arrhizus]KAG0786763.1 hypothetical protein G6F21_008365 [Rhizopus arrhizus]KAG0790352.1 hypothetical protein G6F22_006436 [Rhizopus arrhizus]